MSGDDLTGFWVDQVTVEPYLGKSGTGTILYDVPVTLTGSLSRKQTFVRDANGEQVVSSTSFSCDASHADELPPKSRVTIPGQAQPTTIISRQVSTGTAEITGLDSVKVYLQ